MLGGRAGRFECMLGSLYGCALFVACDMGRCRTFARAFWGAWGGAGYGRIRLVCAQAWVPVLCIGAAGDARAGLSSVLFGGRLRVHFGRV